MAINFGKIDLGTPRSTHVTMLDLGQNKLTRVEWESIEKPLPAREVAVLNLISAGFHNPAACHSTLISLLDYIKVPKTEGAHWLVYDRYLRARAQAASRWCRSGKDVTRPHSVHKVKKADQLRIANSDKKLKGSNLPIYELVALDALEVVSQASLESVRGIKALRGLWFMAGHSPPDSNPMLGDIIREVCAHGASMIDVDRILQHAAEILESNEWIEKLGHMEVFQHQADLFAAFKTKGEGGKLVSYIAPTGTGKTLSPVGLCSGHKVIFVCAARHVGLALARACVASGKKVGFAFGCSTESEIRLHFNASTDCVRDSRSGAIARVNNMAGEQVEILVSDLLSYPIAMRYMMQFSTVEDLLLYWDEPTISMDRSDDPLHPIIRQAWSSNAIPNVVLASATLPVASDIQPTIQSFCAKFPGASHTEIRAGDERVSVPVLFPSGKIAMPHTVDPEVPQSSIARHCREHPAIKRYIDLASAARYVRHSNAGMTVMREATALEVKVGTVKDAYLAAIDAGDCRIDETTTSSLPCGPRLSTQDAASIRNGPAIYLAEEVEKIGRFLWQEAKIPKELTMRMQKILKSNRHILSKAEAAMQTFEERLRSLDAGDKKLAKDRIPANLRSLRDQAERLANSTQVAELPEQYKPNTDLHRKRFGNSKVIDAHVANIDTDTSERIMGLMDVPDQMKLLLLMGIGVFSTELPVSYQEIMKELASQQRLLVVISSSDFIYGTNYQFTHGYIGKDLEVLSQEKLIQALGRVGRRNAQCRYTFRLRSEKLAKTLFTPPLEQPEVASFRALLT